MCAAGVHRFPDHNSHDNAPYIRIIRGSAACLTRSQNGSITTMFENDTPENVDLEAGAEVVRPEPTASNPAAADVPGNGNGNGNGAGNGTGNGNGNGVRSSSWSAHELVQRAEALDRVRVTPAWSLSAALGAGSSSSSSSPSSLSQTSAAATIVRQVASAQAFGLVVCGCAGPGPLATSPGRQQRGVGVGAATETVNGSGSNDVPLSGTRSVHGKWPSLGIGSRHGPSSLSLMTRSWHGKSRHHARGSHRAREAAAAANGGGGGRFADGSRPRQSGLASAVNMVINNALWDLVGDVAAGLLRSEPAPAVLAVRASKSALSATV